jgi:hypothetical protein
LIDWLEPLLPQDKLLDGDSYRSMYDALDADGDGEVDLQEWEDLYVSRTMGEASWAAALDMYDW